MKCPKCGYLGFEQAERCRNCGYEFALASRRLEPELSLRGDSDGSSFDDLDLVDGASASSRARASSPPSKTPDPIDAIEELPLFDEGAPLITKTATPRAPLSVRRARPEAPRARDSATDASGASLLEPELEMPLGAPVSPAVRAHDPDWAPLAAATAPAGLTPRIVAALIDTGLLALIDVAVVYLTMQICGLTPRELSLVPLGPLAAFLLVQNVGYFVVFTAGGQTIGKMVTGIRVVAAEPDHALDLGRALQRTLVWMVMALPLGLGLLSALLTADRRAFHDRVAGTRVVRAATSA